MVGSGPLNFRNVVGLREDLDRELDPSGPALTRRGEGAGPTWETRCQNGTRA